MSNNQLVYFVEWFEVDLICDGRGALVGIVRDMRAAARRDDRGRVAELLGDLRRAVERVAHLYMDRQLPEWW